MLNAQAIYGPAEAACRSSQQIALGRRLHSILPEDRFDRKPQEAASGRFWLVADARLDNRTELAGDLDLSAGERATACEADLIARAWKAWGPDCVNRLLGDFAFALWDKAECKLYLCRDFLGQRPLHYYRGSGFVAFASMPKGLHALAEVPREPDLAIHAAFLALQPESGSATFFKHVHRVLPGELLCIEGDRVSSRFYWEPSQEPVHCRDPRDYAEAVRTEFDRAVAARLRGCTQRPAAHLSAGLDSSAVVSTAAMLLGPEGRVLALTAVPGSGWTSTDSHRQIDDESSLAALVAAQWPNIDHERVAADDVNLVDIMDRDQFLYERPVHSPVNSAWLGRINDVARSRGAKVLLTGSMGNMSFSYDGLERLPRLLAAGRFVRLGREIMGYRRFAATSLGRAAAPAFLPHFPEALRSRLRRRPPVAKWLRAVSPLREGLVQGLLSPGDGAAPIDRAHVDGLAARLARLKSIDPGNYNKGDLGGWGIDTRDPTADRRLMELCLRLPAEAYFRNGTPRALARDMLGGRVPGELLSEARKGYQAADWPLLLSAALPGIDEELGRLRNCPPALDLLDVDKMRDWMNAWPGADRSPLMISRYRNGLMSGISAGHFIRRIVGSNA